ncbi:MAG: tRNA (adenosine(37)-N6)-threonylcarbamoyltransferase complex dimerization subunit type 1 TsaB [candidate division Zixibacteria bacterium]|nr:tRNA (adenosine(37)-N6)-threonylcarbamoyltransferase complex dimerization subunit type 1 TsaB [candidate division Zixibacteria bacterium]
MILAIDSSGLNLGLALVDDGVCWSSQLLKPGLKHGEVLQTAIADFLEKSQVEFRRLTAIGITLGPGSFTGLRIGMAAAKAYSYSLNIPLTGISTLESGAFGIGGSAKPVVVLFDAKRNEIYWAVFDCSGDTPSRLTPDMVSPAERLEEFARGGCIFFGPRSLGEAFRRDFSVADYRDNDDFNLAIPEAIRGEIDARRNMYLERDELVPIYLRN